MIDIWSDIWVGNWLDKVKEQNRILSGQKATSLTPEEKAVWTNFEIQGRKQFDKFHPGENWNSAQGAAYFANTYILQQRAARKNLATKSSAASASAAAAKAGSAQAKAAGISTGLQQSAASASTGAAAAARAQAEAEERRKQKSAQVYTGLKQTIESASKAGASQARAAQYHEEAAAQGRAAGAKADERAAKLEEQAQHDYEQLLIDNAKLQAQIKQSQGTIDQLREQGQQVVYYNTDTGMTPYYSSGDNMDNNVTLEPVAVKGTNLRNSILLVGGVAFIWWLLKRKKRGR